MRAPKLETVRQVAVAEDAEHRRRSAWPPDRDVFAEPAGVALLPTRPALIPQVLVKLDVGFPDGAEVVALRLRSDERASVGDGRCIVLPTLVPPVSG